jgi:hypothetical protein
VQTIAQKLAILVEARRGHLKTHNAEWFERHTTAITDLVHDHLPSGSGWDQGTQIDLEASTGECLVFYGSFHHMNETGFYDGWTDHTIKVRASLIHGVRLSISGRDRNDLKDHLHELFESALSAEYKERAA